MMHNNRGPMLGLILTAIAVLCSCQSGVYLNTENDPHQCMNLPNSQQEECRERAMSQREYEREREKILEKNDN